MRKIKNIFFSIITALLCLAPIIKAEAATPVNIYFFYGDGCGFCAAAEEWFENLDEDTLSKINLVRFEVWNNSNNSALLTKTAEHFDMDTSKVGIPFIVIGDQTVVGFAEGTTSDRIRIVDDISLGDKFIQDNTLVDGYTTYIVPIKFPSTSIIQEALALYQNEFRKPIHTVFCLDYSGSMIGDGIKQLTSAMEYILTEEKAKADLLQYTEKDKITVIPFSSDVLSVWQTEDGTKTEELISQIQKLKPSGSTNIYDTSIRAIELLDKEDMNKYNVSVILMTDGMSNMGNFSNLTAIYKKAKKEIPIYSITFGDAYEVELQEIADLTNAKVFDGKTDLLKAFKEVRGYN